MTQDTLKLPFFISIIFHAAVILSIALFYQPVKETMRDITPIEFLRISEEDGKAPLEAVAEKQAPVKVSKAVPSVPKMEEKPPLLLRKISHRMLNSLRLRNRQPR